VGNTTLKVSGMDMALLKKIDLHGTLEFAVDYKQKGVK
jgi:hypothetical protein